MDHLNGFANENNQARRARPPQRVCPRCNSNNTKFCYYNNYSLSQPRYVCKNCRRYWTHGGALRNIPVGGSGRKPKRPNVDQSSVSQTIFQTVSIHIQPVNHQPFSYVQQNNEFSGSFGASSSSAAAATVKNHFESFSDIHLVTHVLESSDESFNQDYNNAGSANSNGNPLINQSFGGHVDNHSGYRINQVDQLMWNQSFSNLTNMGDNASTSGSRESDMNMNNEDNKTKYNKSD